MDIELEPYDKDLIVTIEPAERQRRIEVLAFERPLVFETIAEAEGIEDAGWEKAKADHKSALAGFVSKRRTLERDMGAEARVLKAGEEEKPVRCEDRIEVGPGNVDLVTTYRLDRDPPEVVGKPRVATRDELKAWRRKHGIEDSGVEAAAANLRGTLERMGATMTITAEAPGNGHDPTDIASALDRELAVITTKPRNETLVYKALEKGIPASTPLDRKACVERNLAAGYVGEVGGKLLWAPNEPQGTIPGTEPAAATTH